MDEKTVIQNAIKAIEIEERVIKTILNFPELASILITNLDGQCFSTNATQGIFSAAKIVFDKYGRVTKELIYSTISAKRWWESIGGKEHVENTIEKRESIVEDDLTNYLEILYEKRGRKNILKISSILKQIVKDTSEPLTPEKIEQIEQLITKKLTRLSRDNTQELEELVFHGETAHQLYVKTKERLLDSDFIGTGFPTIDEILIEGFLPPGYTILAGPTSVGKSLFLQNLALNWAKIGQPCLLIVPEPKLVKTFDRLLAIHNNILLSKIKRTFLKGIGGTKTERKEILEMQRELTKLPIYIVEQRGLSFKKMCDIIQFVKGKIRHQFPNKELIVGIDVFKDIIDVTRANQEGPAVVSTLVKRIEETTDFLNIHLIPLLHFNRQYQHRDEEEPRVSDIEHGAAYEQKAQNILFLTRPFKKDKSRKTDDILRVWINKQREGEAGKRIDMKFIGETTRIIDPQNIKQERVFEETEQLVEDTFEDLEDHHLLFE